MQTNRSIVRLGDNNLTKHNDRIYSGLIMSSGARGGAAGYSVSNAFGNGVLRSAIFKGTTAQWNALTPDVQSTYFTAILVD